MAKYAVDVQGSTYEVEAPDENTAWRWAVYTHKNPEKPKERTWGEVAKDVGVTTAKGVIGLPQAVAGILDIPTLGYASKGLEAAGVRFADAQKILDQAYSPAQQEAFKKVEAAEGFVPSLKALIQNPSVPAHMIGQSIPQMIGGAAIGRKALQMLPAMGEAVAAGVGEGVLGAGSAASQIREGTPEGTITPKQALAALGSGVGTGVFGVVGSKVAGSKAGQRLGLSDIDTMLVRGGPQAEIAGQAKAGFIKSVLGSGISEGAFEELPQSVQEQMWQNWATDKPLDEGLGKAAATGLVTGSVAGGAAGGFGNLTREAPPPPPTPPQAETIAVQPIQAQTPEVEVPVQPEVKPLAPEAQAAAAPVPPSPPAPVTTPEAPIEGRTAEEIIAKLGELIKDPSVDRSTIGSLREEYKKATGEVAPFPLVQAALARSKPTAITPNATYIAPDTSKYRNKPNVPTDNGIDNAGNQSGAGVSVPSEAATGKVADAGAGALGGTEPPADKLNVGTVAAPPALAAIEAAQRHIAQIEADPSLIKFNQTENVVRTSIKQLGGAKRIPTFTIDTTPEQRVTTLLPILKTLVGETKPAETAAPAAPIIETKPPVVEAPVVEAPATPAVTPEAIKASRDKAALILKSNNLPRSKEALDTFADESGVIDQQKVVDHVKAEKAKPKKQKDALSQEEVDTKLDEISLNPDAKKTDVLRIAKQLADQGTIDQADLESLKRIAKDRDLTVDDVRTELETTLRIKNEKGETAAQIELGTSGKVDEKFGTFTTIQQALNHIIKTGNAFEKLLAQRLRPFMGNVEYEVVTPNKAAKDPQIQEKLNTARGVYYEFVGEFRIVKRISIKSHLFGASQGSNIKTVLHEALHAATVKKINLGLQRTDAAVSRITNDLYNLMKEVGAAYKERGLKLNIPAVAFENVKEFITYGMTDPALQEFMATLEGKKQSFLSRFVENVRKFFNFGPQDQSAFMDLVALTDKLLSTRTKGKAVGKNVRPELLQEATAAINANAGPMKQGNAKSGLVSFRIHLPHKTSSVRVRSGINSKLLRCGLV